MKIEFRVKLSLFTLLLGVNLIVFLLALVAQSTVGFDGNLFYIFGGLDATKVYSGSLWLLITSAFFHIEILHFGFNFYVLYKVGQVVENLYDNKVLFLTYILGALGGSILSYATSYFWGQNLYSLGASGAIFALIGLLVGGSLKRNRYSIDLPISTRDLLPIIIIALGVGLIPGSNINNWAHIGGLLTGIVLGLLIKHSLGGYRFKTEELVRNILYYISLIIFIGSYIALLYNAFNIIFIQ